VPGIDASGAALSLPGRRTSCRDSASCQHCLVLLTTTPAWAGNDRVPYAIDRVRTIAAQGIAATYGQREGRNEGTLRVSPGRLATAPFSQPTRHSAVISGGIVTSGGPLSERATAAAAVICEASAARWVGICTGAGGMVTCEGWSGPGAPAPSVLPSHRGPATRGQRGPARSPCNAGGCAFRSFWIITGVGKITVGLNPENTNINLHLLAAFNIPVGCAAILLLSLSIRHISHAVSVTGIVLAVIGLAGTALSTMAEFAGATARTRDCRHRGIARTRVVLSRRLACCQSEAARHHISDLHDVVCP